VLTLFIRLLQSEEDVQDLLFYTLYGSFAKLETFMGFAQKRGVKFIKLQQLFALLFHKKERGVNFIKLQLVYALLRSLPLTKHLRFSDR
jgi:hypothetical protein